MRVLLAAALLFLFSVSAPAYPHRDTLPDGTAVTVDVLPNFCLGTATEFFYALDAYRGLHGCTWARIVGVILRWPRSGHALTVYTVPGGEVYSYDSQKFSEKIGTTSHELRDIEKALKRHNPRIAHAYWITSAATP